MGAFKCYYLLILFCLEFVLTVYSLSVWPRPSMCPAISIPHGRVRLKQRGKSAMFQCSHGYELFGQVHALCINRRWDVPPPICIKNGCPRFTQMEHGNSIYIRNGAAVLFFCESGYNLTGTEIAVCDGKQWNATLPKCVDYVSAPPLSCDFESEDLCGWVQDPITNIEWRRSNRRTMIGIFHTGPSFDHTYGFGQSGHYMYMESSRMSFNKTARLISPLYRGNITEDGCFNFYYHMFGRNTGTLRVLMKPENIELQNILSDPILYSKYLLLEKSGSQNNTWLGYSITLTEEEQNFQIIIDGIRGNGIIGGIAFDDVSILQGAQCTTSSEITTSKSSTQETEAYIRYILSNADTCLNRCSEANVSPSPNYCHCYDGCLEDNNCCADYQDICVFSTSTETSTLPNNRTAPKQAQYSTETNTLPPNAHPPLPPFLKMTATKITKAEDVETITNKISTTVKSMTTKKPSTVIRTTTSTTPKPTTAKVTATTRRNITTTGKPTRIVIFPRLKFLTSEQPVVNATGRINNHNVPKSVTIQTTKSTVSTPKSTTVLPLNTTTHHNIPFTTQRTSTSTKLIVPHYSRTFENYHTFVHRKNLKDSVAREVEYPNKNNMADATTHDAAKTNPGSKTIILAVAIPLVIIIVLAMEVYCRGRKSFFRKIQMLRHTAVYEYQKRRGQSSEVRFLTREDGIEEVDL